MGEDVGVPIKQIPALIKRVQQITASVGIPAMKYGHIGDGNLHVALFIDVNDLDQWDRLRTAADRIHRAALSLGGDGQLRAWDRPCPGGVYGRAGGRGDDECDAGGQEGP